MMDAKNLIFPSVSVERSCGGEGTASTVRVDWFRYRAFMGLPSCGFMASWTNDNLTTPDS